MSGQLISNWARRHHKPIHHIGYTIGFSAIDPFCSTHRTPFLDRRGSRAPSNGSPKPPPCQPPPSRPAYLTKVSGRMALLRSQDSAESLMVRLTAGHASAPLLQQSKVRPWISSLSTLENIRGVKTHSWSSTTLPRRGLLRGRLDREAQPAKLLWNAAKGV